MMNKNLVIRNNNKERAEREDSQLLIQCLTLTYIIMSFVIALLKGKLLMSSNLRLEAMSWMIPAPLAQTKQKTK
jgi:hypothetical protein